MLSRADPDHLIMLTYKAIPPRLNLYSYQLNPQKKGIPDSYQLNSRLLNKEGICHV
jgi:hypothetical protein